MKRASGILMHISSLPGKYGCGSFSNEAYRFVDFLAAAKQSYWQVLPLCPTSYGDSPYQSPSAFAGNPYFIDLDALFLDGLLTKEELAENERKDDDKVDYGWLFATRYETLKRAFSRFKPDGSYQSFKEENAEWLFDYALFMAIKAENGYKELLLWKDEYKLREAAAIDRFSREHGKEIEFWIFVQYEFFKQYFRLKTYAKERGVSIIGDMPIYVALDSSDVWANRDCFLLDENLSPTHVAGVPPDMFSEDGQLWGNPLYDWEKLKRDGYSFWKKRLKFAVKMYDLVRIDHFRGFESFYSVPAGATTAKDGEWVKGPDIDLFKCLSSEVDVSKIIAEDLGVLTDDVRKMLKESGYPGMKVLQFGFCTDQNDEYLPKQYPENCIAYTGTHDNETSRQFVESMTKEMREVFDEALKDSKEQNDVYKMIDVVQRSRAQTAIVPIQDWLDLGKEARMNFPSKTGYWTYRVNGAALNVALADKIARMTAESRRA